MSDSECEHLMALIQSIPQTFGCGVLLIEHNMRLVMNTCERLHVMASGRTIAAGAPSEVLANEQFRSAYLGSEAR
jgi:branched-chain amino acid transport system ATP-binding protein